MIDRNARDRAVGLLERFAAGEVANGEMFRVWPESEDEGVTRVADAIMEQVSAHTGDMFSEATAIFTMTGDEPLGPGGRERIERFRLFLQSDCEYTWSHRSASLIGWYMVTLVVFPSWIGIIGYQMLWVPALIVSATAIIPVLQVRRTEQLRVQRERAVLDGPWPFTDEEQLRTARGTFGNT